MGAPRKNRMEADNFPYSSVVRDERPVPRWRGWRLPRIINMLPPAALLFAFSGFWFTYKWNDDRSKEGPCVDCKRQREMVEEVYFNKPTVHKGYRL